jgi:hypothetical protein
LAPPSSTRSATFGKARRHIGMGEVDLSSTPGPGQYGKFGGELLGRGITMSRGERPNTANQRTLDSGPGLYKAYSSFG